MLNKLVQLAPFKLAFVINKFKMPFSSCSAFLEFAASADPKSIVFRRMSPSKDTVTRCTEDIYSKVLHPDAIKSVKSTLYWGIVADEITNSATQEQLALYVYFVNLQKQTIIEQLLQMKRIVGHLTADTISSMMEVLDPSCKLSIDGLVSMTCDGAAVMVSQKGGVAGKMKSINPKIFFTHCPPHRLVLASKAG